MRQAGHRARSAYASSPHGRCHSHAAGLGIWRRPGLGRAGRRQGAVPNIGKYAQFGGAARLGAEFGGCGRGAAACGLVFGAARRIARGLPVRRRRPAVSAPARPTCRPLPSAVLFPVILAGRLVHLPPVPVKAAAAGARPPAVRPICAGAAGPDASVHGVQACQPRRRVGLAVGLATRPRVRPAIRLCFFMRPKSRPAGSLLRDVPALLAPPSPSIFSSVLWPAVLSQRAPGRAFSAPRNRPSWMRRKRPPGRASSSPMPAVAGPRSSGRFLHMAVPLTVQFTAGTGRRRAPEADPEQGVGAVELCAPAVRAAAGPSLPRAPHTD